MIVGISGNCVNPYYEAFGSYPSWLAAGHLTGGGMSPGDDRGDTWRRPWAFRSSKTFTRELQAHTGHLPPAQMKRYAP